MSAITLDEHGLLIAGQPDAQVLRGWAASGVRTVVNLRKEGEDQQPMSVAAEGERCQALGMDYVSLPVSAPKVDAALAAGFEKVLVAAREAGPVAVHCKLGQRAGAMVLIALARHQGWDADRAICEADRLGLRDAVGTDALQAMVRRCVDGDGDAG
jgi:uncharacterized protein (TIGR01244 family)